MVDYEHNATLIFVLQNSNSGGTITISVTSMNSSVGQSSYDTGNDCLSYFLLGFFLLAGWWTYMRKLVQRGFAEGSNRMPPHINGNQI